MYFIIVVFSLSWGHTTELTPQYQSAADCKSAMLEINSQIESRSFRLACVPVR